VIGPVSVHRIAAWTKREWIFGIPISKRSACEFLQDEPLDAVNFIRRSWRHRCESRSGCRSLELQNRVTFASAWVTLSMSMRGHWRLVPLQLVVAMSLHPEFVDAQSEPAIKTAACSGHGVTSGTRGTQGSSDAYARWEKPIPDGTRLCRLKVLLERQAALLPERDLDDRSALPKWFRVLMRKEHADLPTSGDYQYPRTANRVLQGLLNKPDAATIDQLLDRYAR
jgi:hypothetical protein